MIPYVVFRGVASSLVSTIARGGGENVSSVPFYSSKNSYVGRNDAHNLTSTENTPSNQQEQQKSRAQHSEPSKFSFFSNKKPQNLTVEEEHHPSQPNDPTNKVVESRSFIPTITKDPRATSSSSQASPSISTSPTSYLKSIPTLRTVRNNLNQNLFQSFLSNRIKLFNKFKFKGFAVTFIKSVTELNAAGIGVKIPITPSFPVYDSIIYLPRVVALISLNYPYCWKLSFTINVPIQIFMMMLVLFFEHANTVYQIGKRVLTTLVGSQSNKDGDRHEDDEDDELINSFSDRDLLPKNKPQSAASSPSASSTPSPSTSGGKMKAAESVKRLGVSVSYKFTEWGAKGNGWTMGPAFNYVSSLIITNKLLPMMILISVCFFSIVETVLLLMYWMYEIYYFIAQQLLFIMNTFWHIFLKPNDQREKEEIMKMMELRSTTIPGGGEAEMTPSMFSDKIYYDSHYSHSLGGQLGGNLPYSNILQATGGGNSDDDHHHDYFINSNNDLSIYSDYEDYFQQQANSAPSTSSLSSPSASIASAVSVPNETEKENSKTNKKSSLSSLILSMRNRYHNYAQNKLHTQLIQRSFSSSSSSSSSNSVSIWQINWHKIEKWILTKSPVFGYSMSSVMLPFPKKGLKLATNVNFDIQNFHPIEYISKLWELFDVEKNVESMSKNTFM